MLTLLTYITMYPTPLPPSSKTVLEILDTGGAMTHKDLVQKNPSCPPDCALCTQRNSRNGKLIIEKFNFRDARQIIYQYRRCGESEAQPACV